MAALSGLVPGPFVGRERELAALRSQLEAACAGQGHIAVLVGEPGIGKTRTAEELAVYAERQGARVLWGRCYEEGGAPPYWPWVRLLGSSLRQQGAEALRADMGAGAADIAQLVPELLERWPDLGPAPQLEPSQARFRLWGSITAFLINAARRQPLVLVLEDLHWADESSLLLLRFLARELGESHLLLLGTYRETGLGRQHPLSPTLAELARERISERVELHGLGEPDVARFIQLTAGVEPPRALVAAIVRETEGNPFFVTEVVRLLAAEGRLMRPDDLSLRTLTMPPSVRQAIGRRLEGLSERCNRVLRIAAVVGREFEQSVLERVSDLPIGSLLETLEEAMAALVVVETPVSVGGYSFSHALIRETLYDELGPAARVRLHGQVGEALEALHGRYPDSHLPDLAHHFLQAAPGGEAAKAVDYSRRAGDQALAMLAYEDAISHYTHALRTLELQDPAELARRYELLLLLAEGHARAGQMIPTAREIFLQAAELARSLGSAELLARAALGYGGRIVMVGVVDMTLVGLLEEARAALDPGDSALRARVLGRLAQELLFSPDAAERRAVLSHEAVAMARRIVDPETLAFTLEAQRNAIWNPENLEDRLAVSHDILRLGEELANRELLLLGYGWRVSDLLELGDVRGVDAAISSHARLAQQVRSPFHLWNSAMWRAMRALLEGRFDDAEQLAGQFLELGLRIQDPDTEMFFGVQTLIMRREQGRLGELEPHLRAYVEQYPSLPIMRCWLTLCYAELGREAEARRELEYLAAHDFADLPRDLLWLVTVTCLGEIGIFLGDTRRAALLYELLRPSPGATS